MRLVLFCEASADHRTATALVDRVLHEEGPEWVADFMDAYPESIHEIREWLGDGQGRDFFDVHKLDGYRRCLGNVRFPQGHFDGKPGQPGAQMARNAFFLVRQLEIRDPGRRADAVVLVWDMDDQGEQRRRGLDQARSEASGWAPFHIVLGCADRMREAWVLAGFEPRTADERDQLDALRRELGFSPCEAAHRLDAKDEHATRSPKRVLRCLTGGDAEREARCVTEAPLAQLRALGADSGLCAFLDEVRERVVPLCAGPPAAARAR